MQLTEKYVFHIPLSKYVNGKLVKIEIDKLLDNLIGSFNEQGYENLYIVKAKGYYKTRSYDEILITMYTSSNFIKTHPSPDEIFKNWFKRNNGKLQQEAFAYEHNNTMEIEMLI